MGTSVDQGAYLEHGQLVTIRDASDHTAWVSLSTPRYDMTGARWESLGGMPHSYARKHLVDGGTYAWLYLSDSLVVNTTFERSFLYNVHLASCTLRNCHVHFNGAFEIEACVFVDCVLTTDAGEFVPAVFTRDGEDRGSSVLFTKGVVLTNCTLKGNFAREFGPSNIGGPAKVRGPTQLAPYEVHNNIVLRECVVDCLRRWIGRHRQGIRPVKHPRLSKYFPITRPLKTLKTQKALPRWDAKAAGKRPMHVNEVYDAKEQLDLPVRRNEWSVVRVGPVASPPKKRKIDLTGMALDA